MKTHVNTVTTSSAVGGGCRHHTGIILSVTPTVALVDDVVRTTVSGLASRQRVTLAAVVNNEGGGGGIFVSYSHYIADDDGLLDLDVAPSFGGSFVGVEPMGFMFGLQPVAGEKKGLRLMQKDVSRPFVVHLYVFSEHVVVTSDVDASTNYSDNNFRTRDVLAETVVHRYYRSSSVLDYPIRVGRVRGMLFVPTGDGPFPAVIDMFGTAGGIYMTRSALLASRGFVVLSLAYFNYDDLPEHIDLDLEYFEEAVDWLYQHPAVLRTHGIGVVGVSKGAALALHMATVSKKVKAAVAINPYCCHSFGQHRYRGIEQPVVNPNVDDLYITEDGLVHGPAMSYRDERVNSLIPVHQAKHAEFLFIRGEDDPSSDHKHVDILANQLKQRGMNNYRILSYPGAGHLIEPPYTPLCRVCYTKQVGMPVVYGGQVHLHAVAQQDSWQKIIAFFLQHLSEAPRRSSSLSLLQSRNYSTLGNPISVAKSVCHCKL